MELIIDEESMEDFSGFISAINVRGGRLVVTTDGGCIAWNFK
jgi:hypothetical protein